MNVGTSGPRTSEGPGALATTSREYTQYQREAIVSATRLHTPLVTRGVRTTRRGVKAPHKTIAPAPSRLSRPTRGYVCRRGASGGALDGGGSAPLRNGPEGGSAHALRTIHSLVVSQRFRAVRSVTRPESPRRQPCGPRRKPFVGRRRARESAMHPGCSRVAGG